MNSKDYSLPTPEIIKSEATPDYNNPEPVVLYPLLVSKPFRDTEMKLPVLLGINKRNKVVIKDLAVIPHLFIGGDMPSGKSSFIRTVIISLLYKKQPDELKFVLMDTSKKELTSLNGLGNAYIARLSGEEEYVVFDPKTVIRTLNSLTREMNLRYQKFADSYCRNLDTTTESILTARCLI